MVQESVKNIVEALKNKELSFEERSILFSCILDTLAALPLRDIIYVDPTTNFLMLNGKQVENEMGTKLREGAKAVLNNYTFKIVHDQVLFEAIQSGFLKSGSEGQSLTGKAAVWCQQQFIKHLQLLAQIGSPE